ncbi:acyltransferase domain-containing protein, partial [Microbispora sp. NPDC049125]|uniref:acyltransferase domain-containing protein n=1 Tax=Microbispora sp. NPDC049125 TaxID=3154929 RepID=UPI0034672AB9
TPWPTTGHPRRAAISAFGVSGTNAHVIIEQAPDPTPAPPAPQPVTEADSVAASAPVTEAGPGTSPVPGSEPVPVAWVVSARTPEALRGQADRLAAHLQRHPDLDPVDVAHSLATTRARLDHRAVLLGTTREQLLDRTRALAEGTTTGPGVITGSGSGGPIAFVFTGQGSQHPGMGRQLYAAFPAFAHAYDQAITLLDQHLQDQPGGQQNVPLREVLLGDADPALIDQTLYTQTGLFALQIALVELAASWGITPTAVAGHSIGAITAAHTAGILTLPHAAALVTTRATLMHTLPPGGAMTAITTTEDHITQTIADEGLTGINIAAINTPTSTVISGDTTAVHHLTNLMRSRGHKTRHLTVSHAFHSPHMNPITDQFQKAVQALGITPPTGPTIPYISDHTGDLATPDTLTTPRYWADHLRGTVRFADAVRRLERGTEPDEPIRRFVEIGPDAVLTALVRDTLQTHQNVLAVPLLRRNQPEPHTALTAAAHLHTTGTPINWPN